MTLRDWFAGQAIAAMVPIQDQLIADGKREPDKSWHDFYARMAYRYADAMLRAREMEDV
jgi:hypothetical protein